MRKFGLVSCLLLAFLQVELWFVPGTVVELLRLRQTLAQQERENGSLQARNQTLAAEVADLKTGLAAIEERARNELGLIKKGEQYYQIIPNRF